jgi:hypothetical protein
MPEETSSNLNLLASATSFATNLMERIGLSSGKKVALDEVELDDEALDKLAEQSTESFVEGAEEQVQLDKGFKTKMKESLLSVTTPVGEFFKNAWVSFKGAMNTIKEFIDSKLNLSKKISSIKEVCVNLWKKMIQLGQKMGKVIAATARSTGQSISSATKAVVTAPGRFTAAIKLKMEARKNKGSEGPARSE